MFNCIENEEAKIDISPEASRPRPTTGTDDHVGHVLFEMDGSCLEMENGKHSTAIYRRLQSTFPVMPGLTPTFFPSTMYPYDD